MSLRTLLLALAFVAQIACAQYHPRPQAGGGGGDPISDPKVYYVRSDGNDTTGDGSINTPYLTGTKAYDVGVVAGDPFAIDLGVGSFTITLAADWNADCMTVRGTGAATTLIVVAYGAAVSVTNANGGDAYDVSVEVQQLRVNVYASGQHVEATDAGSYTGGAGGNITLTGSALLGDISAAGGGDWFSTDGTVTGGAAGTITLAGALRPGTAFAISCAGGSQYNGGGDGADGTLNSDGCDLRGTVNVGANNGTLNLGRTSYDSGLSYGTGTLNDKGGNAVW